MEFQASLTTAFPNDTNFTDGTLPKTLSAVTASLSLMGSLTIFLTFWMSPDLRTTARKMIVFITVADFPFAGTTIVDYLEDRLGSTGYFVRTLEVTIPRIMALVSSLIWTVHLSFFFYLTLLLIFFHITAWGVPFVITVVAYFFNGVQLLADLETGYKCWIWNEKTCQTMCIWTIITGEGWAIMTYITMTVFYLLVKQHIGRELLKKTSIRSKKFDWNGAQRNRLILHLSWVAHPSGANPGFCCMKPEGCQSISGLS